MFYQNLIVIYESSKKYITITSEMFLAHGIFILLLINKELDLGIATEK